MAEMWLEAKRPFSDTEPLTNDTDTTRAPQELVLAGSRYELAQILVKRYPSMPEWKDLLLEAQKTLFAETVSRPEIPVQPIKRSTLGRI